GRGSDGPAVGRNEHAVHRVVIDNNLGHLDGGDRRRNAVIGRGVDDGAGGEHGNRGGHFHGLFFIRPAPHQGEDIQHAVALLAVVAVHRPLNVVAAEGEGGLPT